MYCCEEIQTERDKDLKYNYFFVASQEIRNNFFGACLRATKIIKDYACHVYGGRNAAHLTLQFKILTVFLNCGKMNLEREVMEDRCANLFHKTYR